MAEQMSMDSILNDDKPEPAAPAAVEKPAAEAPAAAAPVERPTSSRKEWADKEQAAQGRVRDPETGQFVKAEEKPAEPAKEPAKPEAKAEPVAPAPPAAPVAAPAAPAAPAPQEMTEKERAFLRAVQEERGKRQELERRLAAIEAARTQPAAPGEAPKTFWDDPEGSLKKHQEEIRKETVNARLQTAELIARRAHPDFDEKIEVFRKIAEQTPGLVGQMLAAQDPAEFAYGLGKNHLELQQAGSIEGLRAQIEKETRVKLEAELKEKADKLAAERAALPPSLSEAPSRGVNRPTWGGPPSMEDILKG
jgi:hypothetical protein